MSGLFLGQYSRLDDPFSLKWIFSPLGEVVKKNKEGFALQWLLLIFPDGRRKLALFSFWKTRSDRDSFRLLSIGKVADVDAMETCLETLDSGGNAAGVPAHQQSPPAHGRGRLGTLLCVHMAQPGGACMGSTFALAWDQLSLWHGINYHVLLCT